MSAVIIRFPQQRTLRFVPLADLRSERSLEAMNLPVLAEWTDWMRAEGRSELTINARVRRIEMFAEQIGDPLTATTQDVVSYMASLYGIGPSTRATYFSHLRAWFAWLVQTDKRDDNPTAKIKAPKSPARKPRPVTERQLRLIMGTTMRKRTRMMVLLATFQGLRAHEIAKFRGEDIDYTAKQLRVIGKGKKDATLPLHPLVAEWAHDFPVRGYWFKAQGENKSGHIHPRSVSSIIGDVLRRAGVPTGAAHRLRHTYGTRMVKQGKNIRVIQELLRHSSLQTTQIYTGVTFEQQREALESLGLPADDDDEEGSIDAA